MAIADTFRALFQQALTWTPFLLLVIAAGAIAWLFHKTLMQWLKATVKRTKLGFDNLLVHSLHPSLVFLVFMFVIWAGVRAFAAWIPSTGMGWIRDLAFVAMALMAAMTAARMVQAVLQHQVHHQPRWTPAVTLANRVTHLIVYAVAFLVVLDHYDVAINPLLTSLGIAGLAVALALQDTLANFFAGVWIQSARNVNPGNFVRLEGIALDVQGYVVEVGWRTTKVRTLAGNYAIIPNSKITQSVVVNYHLPRPETEIRMAFATGYDRPPQEVEAILLDATREAAKEFRAILLEPPPKVQILDDLTPDQVKYTLRLFVRDLPDQFRAQHEIRSRVLQRLKKEGRDEGLAPTPLGPASRDATLEHGERSQPPTADQRAAAAELARRRDSSPLGAGERG